MIRIPHLETDVTTACQLSCVACNHHVPLYRTSGILTADPRVVARDLTTLAKFVHADRWGALGGEPLLHARLVDVLRAARASGVADVIEVWTNGLMLERMKNEFWSAFDVLVLSVYDGKHSDESLDWIARKCRTVGVELVVKDERAMRNFRTLFEKTPTDPVRTREKFDGCFFRKFSRVANDGFFYTCCCAPHMPTLVQNRPRGSDGIAIATATEEDIAAYLARTEPLGCCNICAGRDTAAALDWREEREPFAWLRASAGVEA